MIVIPRRYKVLAICFITFLFFFVFSTFWIDLTPQVNANHIIFFNNEDLMINSRSRMKKMYKSPVQEMKMILELLFLNLPFAFSRYRDIEYYLMTGSMVTNGSHDGEYKRFWDKDWQGYMSRYLINSLEAPKGLYFYALPEDDRWKIYKKEIIHMSNYSIEERFITSHMLFHGDALDLFKKKFLKPALLGVSFGRPLILVINKRYAAKEQVLKDIFMNDIFYVPDDEANFFEIEENLKIFELEIIHFCTLYGVPSTFLLEAGPISEIIIRKIQFILSDF